MNLKEQALWLSEFYAEAAKGKVVQTRGSHNEVWIDAPDGSTGPCMTSDRDYWRLVSKPKTPIDLDPLLECGLGCDLKMNDGGVSQVGTLTIRIDISALGLFGWVKDNFIFERTKEDFNVSNFTIKDHLCWPWEANNES